MAIIIHTVDRPRVQTFEGEVHLILVEDEKLGDVLLINSRSRDVYDYRRFMKRIWTSIAFSRITKIEGVND